MSDFVAPFAVIVRVALIDADHRVLLLQNTKLDDGFDFPGVLLQRGDDPLQHMVDYLRHHYQVETLPKAFFPVAFALDDEDAVTLLYGCRNWTGPNGLQHVMAHENIHMQWTKPARMGDYDLSPSCLMMMPNVITLLG